MTLCQFGFLLRYITSGKSRLDCSPPRRHTPAAVASVPGTLGSPPLAARRQVQGMDVGFESGWAVEVGAVGVVSLD